MQIEICPTNGEFCRTFETHIQSKSDVLVGEHNLIGEAKLAVKKGTTRLLPLRHLIQLIQDADRTLQGIHAHPRDLTVVGVRTEDAEALKLFVARKSSRQPRLDEDLVEETQTEREAAKALAHRIYPLIDRLYHKQLSTEKLCATLSAEADPARARAAFVSLANAAEPISDGDNIIHEGTNEPRRTIEVKGTEVHQLVGRVFSVDQSTRSCRVRLASLPGPSSIFSEKDVGVRVFNVALIDEMGWLLASLAASLNETLEMMLSINAKLDSRGDVTFSAKLVGFQDAKKACKRLEAALADNMASLFS